MKRFVILSLIAAAMSPKIASAKDCSLTVGVVPQFAQRKIEKIWTPILEELGQRTNCHYTLAGVETISDFEKAFHKGAFDIAYMNPYHALMAYDAAGYSPIIRSGSKKLKGILAVHKDSGITDIQQLNGKTIAFPSPNALGASLLMRAELATKHGIHIEPLYVKTHTSVYLHVVKKLTSAGGGVMRTFKEQKSALQDKMNILYTTESVPSHPLVVHPRVDASMQRQIQLSWIEISKQDQSILDAIPMKQPIMTSLKDYKTVREMGLETFAAK